MRKLSAALCTMIVMAATFAALALPAGAQENYPPVPPTEGPSNQAANLAFTGSDSTPLVLIGIVAVVLGAVLVVAARRRGTVGARSV